MKTIIIAAAVFMAAAEAHQLTWEGEVGGIVVLHVHGKKVDVEYKDGPQVQRARYRFTSPLPETRQNVRLEVREGRGSVRITKQPGLDGGYAADVTIEDRQDGSSFYSIALYWDSRANPAPGRVDHVRWSGAVDGEVMVECRGALCVSKVERGESVGRERFKFSHPMPEAEVRVMLDETSGQAEIRVLEQPSERNRYTARVAVRSMLGSTPCSFVLSWESAGRAK